MRSIIRLVAASALALPVIIGAAGIASADVEYDHSNLTATQEGAFVHEVMSGSDGHGSSYFVEHWEAATPYGAGSAWMAAWTHEGHAGYYDDYSWSGPEGAYVGHTAAHANGVHHGNDG